MWEKKLELYDEAVGKCPRFDRKGKTMPYTSANGHMFSLLNKAGELGVRFSKEIQQKYIEDLIRLNLCPMGQLSEVMF